MKLIIAGSREISNYHIMWNNLQDYLYFQDIIVVSGKAKGPDTMGEEWAREHGFPIEEFPADWESYGKLAGFRRNRQMAEYADELIAFWDGKSNGTRHMIQCMLTLKKPFQVILVR